MYDPVMATLVYGKLSNGMGIPCAYALEVGKQSVIFQNPSEFVNLAFYLGAPVNPDVNPNHHTEACEWLDKNLGEQFDISGTYAEFFND